MVDSAACLPPDTGPCEPIIVPMSVTVDGTTYRDGADLDPAALYRKLSLGMVATTAAPSPQEFADAFRIASNEADAAVCITVSNSYSTSFDSASLAARNARLDLPKLQIICMDSGSAAGGQGLVCLSALRAAGLGKSPKEVEASARWVSQLVRLVAYVESTEHLWRGGRIPRIAHQGSALLSMRPMFEVSPDGISRRMPARSARTARKRLIDAVASNAGEAEITACVMHGAAPEEAQRTVEGLRATVSCQEVYTTEFSAVMGAHIGPGAVGIAYVRSEAFTTAPTTKNPEATAGRA